MSQGDVWMSAILKEAQRLHYEKNREILYKKFEIKLLWKNDICRALLQTLSPFKKAYKVSPLQISPHPDFTVYGGHA